jgi:acyl carrier protein
MSIKARLRKYLSGNSSYFGPEVESIGDDFPLVDSGALDSLGIFDLVVYLEREFSIRIEVEDLTKGSFGSISEIEKLILMKSDSHEVS